MNRLSKATSKFIQSLQIKKYRQAEKMFVVEGEKIVLETCQSEWGVDCIVGTEKFFNNHPSILNQRAEKHLATEAELTKVSHFQTNQMALAVVRMKKNKAIDFHTSSLLLDDIRDPGNLGTIVRIADWFGITQVIASPTSTDIFNPKTLQASMGSFLRVAVHYHALPEFIAKNTTPIYAAVMDGKSIHTVAFSTPFHVVIGNESNGISQDVLQLIKNKITIPKIGHAESLNAAVATGIILSHAVKGKV